MYLQRCADPDSPLAEVVDGAARRHDVDRRALTVRALLHLPRIARFDGYLKMSDVAREIAALATELSKELKATEDLVSENLFALERLKFSEINTDVPDRIISSRHYLRSSRPGSCNFALLDPDHGLPVSLCSVSPLEWRRVAGQIQARVGVPPERVWDVSRVYSCASAPPNAISYLLARVRRTLRDAKVELLTTSVDQNLGFTGASYLAANWKHWFTVKPRPYLYHAGRYVSPRQLRARFGSSRIDQLREDHPTEVFERSRAPLRDTLIFCCRINGETEAFPEDWRRPLHR